MVVNDIYMPYFGKNLSIEQKEKNGLKLSRIVLVLIGLFSFALAWNPPKLVGLFAQKGVYAIAAASFVPILFGVLSKQKIEVWIIGGAASIGFFGHLILNTFMGFVNPSVSSSIAMLSSVVFALVSIFVVRKTSLNKLQAI